jgi:hypothetical protein
MEGYCSTGQSAQRAVVPVEEEEEEEEEFLEKYSNITFHEDLSCEIRVVACLRQTNRQTDRHDEGNSSFSQFCERA